MGNPVAGVTGMSHPVMRASPEIFSLVVKIAGEALTVARTLGVQVEPVGSIPAQAYLVAARGLGLEGLRRRWMEAGRVLGAGRPSLFQDAMKGRRTEVDYLNGYVVRKGREVGVPTPMNEAIVEITKRMEAGEPKPDPGNLKLLTRHLESDPTSI